ncbi:MAG: hypothetical protein ACKPKO_32580 [Candidatus Fonsibacter sp.]
MVGLGNVDNTSDLNKPISTSTQTALNAKAPLANPSFSGSVGGISKVMVGLGNVDNTSDLDKPISNLTQTALHGKQGTLTSVTDLSIRTSTTTGNITGNQGSFAYVASTGASKPSTISQTGCYLGCDSNNQAGL